MDFEDHLRPFYFGACGFRAHERRAAVTGLTRCLEGRLRGGQPVRPQVSRCIRLSASDRKYPALTGRSGTQRALSAVAHDGWLRRALVLVTISRPASGKLAAPCPVTDPTPPNPIAAGPGDVRRFSQARLGVYMSPALTEAVPCGHRRANGFREGTGLHGGFQEDTPHFHPHTGCRKHHSTLR